MLPAGRYRDTCGADAPPGFAPQTSTFTTTSSLAMIWRFFLTKDRGIMNWLLSQIGIAPVAWLSSADWAIRSVILYDVWKSCGYLMVYYLAGLQGIPRSVMEAAAIDGASTWQSFTRVTLPLLRRIILFVLVSDTVINFFLFAPIFLLTRGGPELSTNLLMYDAYRRGFVWGDLGGSGAMTIILLLVVVVVVVLEFRLLRTE